MLRDEVLGVATRVARNARQAGAAASVQLLAGTEQIQDLPRCFCTVQGCFEAALQLCRAWRDLFAVDMARLHCGGTDRFGQRLAAIPGIQPEQHDVSYQPAIAAAICRSCGTAAT